MSFTKPPPCGPQVMIRLITTSLILVVVILGLLLWLAWILYRRYRGQERVEVPDEGVAGPIDLESEDIVMRRSYPESPPRVEYELTKKGQALLPIVHEMRRFGHEWLGCGVHDEPASAERRRR